MAKQFNAGNRKKIIATRVRRSKFNNKKKENLFRKARSIGVDSKEKILGWQTKWAI